MGGGSFSSTDHATAVRGMKSSGTHFARSATAARTGVFDVADILDPKQLKNGMRESCFAEGFDDVLPVVVGLDCTGSMGSVPGLVQDHLPELLDLMVEQGITDHPNVMFIGFDDEHALPPTGVFQMSQFEIGHEELANSLNELVIPKHGGGNSGEAYHIFFYAIANHTKLECFEENGQKGFAFIIGDEPPYYDCKSPMKHGMLPSVAKACFGDSIQEEIPMVESIRKAAEMYHIFCIRPHDTSWGKDPKVSQQWREMFTAAGVNPQHVLEVESWNSIIPTMALSIGQRSGHEASELIEVLKSKGVEGVDAASTATKDIAAYTGVGGSLATRAEVDGDLELSGSGRDRG